MTIGPVAFELLLLRPLLMQVNKAEEKTLGLTSSVYAHEQMLAIEYTSVRAQVHYVPLWVCTP